MKKTVCALLIGAMVCSLVSCGGEKLPSGSETADPPDTASSEPDDTQDVTNPVFDHLIQSWNARTYTAEDGTNLPFQLYIPPDYDANKSYPCILYMHSAGVKCDDNSHIYKGEAKFLQKKRS